jgi:glutamate synthase (NADPH/NADH) small chain
MGEIKGFIKYERKDYTKEEVNKRVGHYHEFLIPLTEAELRKQGARCMDCGVPFCEFGCPLGNLIPEWNDLIYNNRWKEAAERLLATNNFPEFTGRVCPALCENSCVVGINQSAVTIKNIEKAIIEKAFEREYIQPYVLSARSGRKIAVIGSGPSGLAAADQLNKYGHNVTVFEKNEVLGGLLALGIPDFKLEKKIIERRLKLMKEEGITFKTNVNVGEDVKLSELKENYDAVLLCGGAEEPRDLKINGRELEGIYFAMDFLRQQNRRNGNRKIDGKEISAKEKHVVVIGGGDTGSDCVGTSIRQGAKSVVNLELFPKPPKERLRNNPWPEWAKTDRLSTSHEEGCMREFSVRTKAFIGNNGKVEKLKIVRLKFGLPDSKTGKREISEISGSEFEIKADLVILALGFSGPTHNELIKELGIKTDIRNNVFADDKYMTNVDGIFTAGDMHTGQSLVVRAINEGRKAAESIDKYLG